MSVMVVDDSLGTLVCVRDILTHHGYRVTTCSSASEALEKIAQEVPQLLIVDLLMPGMDGIQLIKTLRSRKEYEGLPIVMLTVVEDESRRVEALDAGANDFLSKPFNTLELIARVRTHFRMGQLIQALAQKVEEVRNMEQLKEDLTGMLVHDMKSPLTAMYGTLELLNHPEEHRKERLVQHLRRLRYSHNLLMNFVANVLDVWAAGEKGLNLRKEDLDLAAFIAEIDRECSNLFFSDTIRIVTEVFPDLPGIRGDKTIL